MNKFKMVYFMCYTCRQAVTGWQAIQVAVWQLFAVKKENNYPLKVHNKTQCSQQHCLFNSAFLDFEAKCSALDNTMI